MWNGDVKHLVRSVILKRFSFFSLVLFTNRLSDDNCYQLCVFTVTASITGIEICICICSCVNDVALCKQHWVFKAVSISIELIIVKEGIICTNVFVNSFVCSFADCDYDLNVCWFVGKWTSYDPHLSLWVFNCLDNKNYSSLNVVLYDEIGIRKCSKSFRSNFLITISISWIAYACTTQNIKRRLSFALLYLKAIWDFKQFFIR